MDVVAKLNYTRMSPRKVKLVIDLVRGLSVQKAEEQLKHMSKQSAPVVLKLLASAVANATNNFKLDKQSLFIKTVTVNQGPVLKRFRPRAFGRAAGIRKPTCHIALIVSDEKVTKSKAIKKS